MNDKEKILWLATRLREYESYLRLKDMTFLDDIPTDWEYCKKNISNAIEVRK